MTLAENWNFRLNFDQSPFCGIEPKLTSIKKGRQRLHVPTGKEAAGSELLLVFSDVLICLSHIAILNARPIQFYPR